MNVIDGPIHLADLEQCDMLAIDIGIVAQGLYIQKLFTENQYMFHQTNIKDFMVGCRDNKPITIKEYVNLHTVLK